MLKITLNDRDALSQAESLLTAGKVIAYPTDTLYGFGADAENPDAVSGVYTLKERSAKKDVLIAVPDLQMAQRYVIVDDRALILAKAFLPGPVSLVLPRTPGSKTIIGENSSSIGIRIPNHDFVLALTNKLGRGITSTSINISEQPSLIDPADIENQFGTHLALLVEDGIRSGPPSTVVDLTGDEVRILREGVIPEAAIIGALHS